MKEYVTIYSILLIVTSINKHWFENKIYTMFSTARGS
jgi:hypothetical protein